MNNYPQIINPNFTNVNLQLMEEIRNINNKINLLTQEIRRIDRRVFNLEKSFIPPQDTKPIPVPLNTNNSNIMNSNYSKDNYII